MSEPEAGLIGGPVGFGLDRKGQGVEMTTHTLAGGNVAEWGSNVTQTVNLMSWI